MSSKIVFIDLEITKKDKKIFDFGAIDIEKNEFHSPEEKDFSNFISKYSFICGHNIIEHDIKYYSSKHPLSKKQELIDTLYLSPLLFPNKPYHKLVKDDKLQNDQLNNPLSDSKKAMELFHDEVNAYNLLPQKVKHIYYSLLNNDPHFSGFFKYVGTPVSLFSLEYEIESTLSGLICSNANIIEIIRNNPIELAYVVALLRTTDKYSIYPSWLTTKYPDVEKVITKLRSTPCKQGCPYCKSNLDINKKLKDFFGFDSFRTYDGEPLQQNAAQAAVDGKSLLAIFPTGGGKSITFQLPAFISGESERGLTVVISPLQSLMKDQVDSLERKGMVDAVTINGLLNPIERAEAIERVRNGIASILYISPESLRSRTIESVLLSRNVVRFVIDEAHCFSAWGQDFRVDYLYIGDFIADYIQRKGLSHPIPVSCFTATAKQKVVSDIQDYFRKKLGLELELFTTSATRKNLHYSVRYTESEEEKYQALRTLIESKNCPTIVYVSRTAKTESLAERLTADGHKALPFNGKMDSKTKIDNQETFINDEVRIIVATSAFGMGVDKSNVGLVVHYEISDSIENYVQEAGRAGRDQSIQAECIILYNEKDLDKHFLLLNQSKLTINEIQQVWKAIKDLAKYHPTISRSPLEIARQAGWDEGVHDIETRVKTAISALESAGYITRGKDIPRLYATSIAPNNMINGRKMIEDSYAFDDTQKQNAIRIINSLISKRSVAKAGNDEAESRIDYLADTLGIDKYSVIEAIDLMKENGILKDDQDMSAYIKKTDTINKSLMILKRVSTLEKYLLTKFAGKEIDINYKEVNDNAIKEGINESSIKNIKTILYFWRIKELVKKVEDENGKTTLVFESDDIDQLTESINKRIEIADFIVEHLFSQINKKEMKDEVLVNFSLTELKDSYNNRNSLLSNNNCNIFDIKDALLYLAKIEAMNLEGGFFVSYNALSITRLVTDNLIRYKKEDYNKLDEFYKQKIQQVHIVGEYANLMVKDYSQAIMFVDDYFQLEYKAFIAKYFKGNRANEINLNITKQSYDSLFGELSDVQRKIISDDSSKYITVIAGPGSGKTRVLVHKLASLLLMEDIKSEQLLMLTFSRAAATEFKSRLIELIGSPAYYVDIKTFHSYCFDLLGKIGNIEEAENVVETAAAMIESGEIELGKITKSVLVIDEAQDMDEHEYALVKALIDRNEDMRVIAVGDDDQNIYEFRGSSSEYMNSLTNLYNSTLYEMVDNYRSDRNIVEFSNNFAHLIEHRMKTNDIQSISEDNGNVVLTKHVTVNNQLAILSSLDKNYFGERTCILTFTNDDAIKMASLLAERNYNAKLIQSNDGFDLYDLAEVRLFLKEIDRYTTTPIISKDFWNTAKEILVKRYTNSTTLPIVIKMIEQFESVNNSYYHSDLVEFIKESKIEDFYDQKDSSEILVSTIHKSKGREFDTVYVVLNKKIDFTNEADKRALYVGFTRAKHNLYVHYIDEKISKLATTSTKLLVDDKQYPEPRKVLLELGFHDIVLDFFKDKKKTILSLQSGCKLYMQNNILYTDTNDVKTPVCKLSRRAIDTVNQLADDGYHFEAAEIRFIVAWLCKDDEKEYAVIHPSIHFVKTLNFFI